MQKYRYKGANPSGKRVNGELMAANPVDLTQRLLAANIVLISYSEVRTGFRLFKRKRIKAQDIITITAQIRQLLSAGVTLMDILGDLKQTYEDDSVREVLSNIYESMEGGESFSQALGHYESDFGKVYVSLVAVGERTGQLSEVLFNLETMLKWERSLASKAKKIMIYPSIVATVVLAVVILMMLFVVPQMIGFIKDMGGELGFATLSLIATSNFLQNYWLPLLLGVVLLVAFFRYLHYQSEAAALRMDGWLFRIPLLGQVIYKLKIARVTGALASMFQAGLSFTESLKLAAEVANNRWLHARMLEAAALIEQGNSIHESFYRANVMPSMAVRMIKVGELSGKMDTSLYSVSQFYEEEAKTLIDRIEPTIEPALTIIMAIVVGWVMLAVLGPVYDTISQVPG